MKYTGQRADEHARYNDIHPIYALRVIGIRQHHGGEQKTQANEVEVPRFKTLKH